jgi:hypothetical protein
MLGGRALRQVGSARVYEHGIFDQHETKRLNLASQSRLTTVAAKTRDGQGNIDRGSGITEAVPFM